MIDPALLSEISAEDLRFLEKLDDHRRYNRIDFFNPYPKQRAFIEMGAMKNERCLFAGNQFGKSDIGGYETAMHLTGLYPPDWPGRTWDRAVKAWAAGVTTTDVRDIQQTKLFGDPNVEEELGTGFVPRSALHGKPTLARGSVSGAYDTVAVLHFDHNGTDNGISTLQFKSYEQGRKKFQGRTLDFIWWDEEPEEGVYTEGSARWTATKGMSFMTFTPLEGMSAVVKRFRVDSDPKRGYVQMGRADAPHLTDEHIKDMLSKYPQHQWRARMDGLPLLGSGQVFLTAETQLQFNPGMMIPDHWPKIWGIDFGIGHNFAAVLCAYDIETDTFYVLRTYRISDAIPIMHVDAMLRIAADIPVAWPHDGTQRDKGGTNASETLASQYRKLGLRMLPSHASWPGGGYSTEAAVLEMQQRMADGRFRVSAELADWFDEYRMYHRELDKTTGASVLVKRDDDLLSATMKALMMKRSARPGQIKGQVLRRKLIRPDRRPRSREFDLFTGQPLTA